MIRFLGSYIDDRDDKSEVANVSAKKIVLVTAVIVVGALYAVAGSVRTGSPDIADFPTAEVAKAERVMGPQMASLDVFRR